MPYTPPSQQSPVASRRDSPAISRSNSYTKVQPQQHNVRITAPTQTATRPHLPRSSSSTSYLHRHRRSPSMTSPQMTLKDGILTETPESTPTLPNFPDMKAASTLSSNIRQSPSPVNDLPVPTGAVISPPDSAQNSSDDEESLRKGREPDMHKLAELQAAIKAIEQHREGSPNGTRAKSDKGRLQLGLKVPSTYEADDERLSPRSVLSPGSRKISHSRSATDSAIIDIDRPTESPDRLADSDLEDETRVQKPPMLRKKSGELVRPALRPASAKRRPSSMPGTPTYSKAVHFDSHLEHVRHFLQVDRPLAVSANTSPVDNYDSDAEFPFGDTRSSWQWEIKLANFQPHQDPAPRPARVERVFLASDNKTLVGTVAVQNLAFHKAVVARFTLDSWKTTSEVTAEFNHDIRRATADNLDRFNFNIKLEDLANLENRTLFFCVRYNVNGQDFWDSNNNVNYQVDFSKKKTSGTNSGAHGASQSLSALPRSRPSPPMTAGSKPRPKSASSFDDFAHGFDSEFSASPFNLHDTPIKFRNKSEKPATSPTLAAKNPSQAFGNRYDFGASLSAAISNATFSLGERSGLKPVAAPAAEPSKETPATKVTTSKEAEPKPAALTAGKPALQSQSYNELIDKYCFFGSGKASPQHGKHSSQLDGANDGSNQSSNVSSRSSSEDSSPVPSPPTEILVPAKLSTSPRVSRSPSPATGLERATSPISFGYPYHQARSGGIFSDSTAPTPIVS